MPINNIPGVGPTNADIATAVAAPSAATIAAAVAAPSAATIAAAVNAPSTSAIVAAGNSAGWASTGGLTWTPIATPSLNGTSTYTWSGLSGYKYYKLAMFGQTVANASVYIRFNGDSTSNTYSTGGFFMVQGSGAPASYWSSGANQIQTMMNNQAQFFHLFMNINEANSTGAKDCVFTFNSTNSGGTTQTNNGTGFWSNSAAINSITLLLSSSSFTGNTLCTLYGGN